MVPKTQLTRFNENTIKGLLPGGYSRRRVYIVDVSTGEVKASRAIDYQGTIGNWGWISFRYGGKRFRMIPNDVPFVQGRIEVKSYEVM